MRRLLRWVVYCITLLTLAQLFSRVAGSQARTPDGITDLVEFQRCLFQTCPDALTLGQTTFGSFRAKALSNKEFVIEVDDDHQLCWRVVSHPIGRVCLQKPDPSSTNESITSITLWLEPSAPNLDLGSIINRLGPPSYSDMCWLVNLILSQKVFTASIVFQNGLVVSPTIPINTAQYSPSMQAEGISFTLPSQVPFSGHSHWHGFRTEKSVTMCGSSP
jgi:hypothetical protein